jgi:2-C-methyl-D-erythritol 2,4-cyclodiphosphate synthase
VKRCWSGRDEGATGASLSAGAKEYWAMIRVGFGYDSHRFGDKRPLLLGGIRVPHPKGLRGHSDADVILHAVIDAVLGAASMGDIGTLFPDSDPRFRGVSSVKLLEETMRRVKPRFRVIHVDATLLAEEPRIGPYKNRMRARLARVLGVPAAGVNIKGKTNEGMGFVGRREGLAAVAVATLEEK